LEHLVALFAGVNISEGNRSSVGSDNSDAKAHELLGGETVLFQMLDQSHELRIGVSSRRKWSSR